MAQEWNIRPQGKFCTLCGKPFEDKQPCWSALREQPEGYERIDMCLSCEATLPDDWSSFSAWETQYHAPQQRVERTEPLKKENAEELLRRLITLDDPAMQNAVYVLAVMLERSKQLIERGTRPHESGGLLRIYEHKATGDSFVVLDPQLQLNQIGGVQQQVVALLSGTGAVTPSEPTPQEDNTHVES